MMRFCVSPRCAFDETLCSVLDIKEVTRTALFHVNIAEIRSALSCKDAEILIEASVTSRLRYIRTAFATHGLQMQTNERSLERPSQLHFTIHTDIVRR